MSDDTTKELRGTIQVNERPLQGHVDEVARSSVEDTLNAMLEAEADQLCQAQRYERSPDRADTRAGHYDRKLHTKAGDVTLKVPSSGRCRLRQRSSSGIGGAKRRWKKRWSRCIWP